MKMLHLNRNFFNYPTLDVAARLIGKVLHFHDHVGFITETEAYIGKDDPACHAARGRTKRTNVMFGPPGHAYVYFIYGMYHCLNFVTEPKGVAAAVLIRGLKLLTPPFTHLNGPGKLCRFLQITKAEHNELDIVTCPWFQVKDANLILPYSITPRIGIRQGTDKMWRFVASEKDVQSLFHSYSLEKSFKF